MLSVVCSPVTWTSTSTHLFHGASLFCLALQVRKTLSWPRSWANLTPFSLQAEVLGALNRQLREMMSLAAGGAARVEVLGWARRHTLFDDISDEVRCVWRKRQFFRESDTEN